MRRADAIGSVARRAARTCPRVARRRIRIVLSCALAAAALVPGSLLATLSPPQVDTDQRLAQDYDRLARIRERLTRRDALRRALDRRAIDLERELQDLRADHRRAVGSLRQSESDAAALEGALDRVVPRVLARAAQAKQRRSSAARAIADLAGLSRQAELDPGTRARMLAIGPLMLTKLRTATAETASLAALSSELISRYDEVVRARSDLRIERQDLQRRAAALRQRRASALEHLAGLDTEVRLLGREQRRLAQTFLHVEAAAAARAGPAADRPALDWLEGGPALAERETVGIKGSARGGHPKSSIGALQPAWSHAVAAAAQAQSRPMQTVSARADLPALPPPPAKPLSTTLKGDVGIRLPSAGQNAVDHLALMKVAFVPAKIAAPQRLAASPIMPVPERLMEWETAVTIPGRPVVEIAAAPGQAVAAPEDGRVVFAEPFRSYGLLLIIEHGREDHTLLWGFSRLDVGVEDFVRAGEIIGEMGDGGSSTPVLHLERRQHGRPVNPLKWLAASSSKVRG